MPESEEDRDAPGLQLQVLLEVDALDGKRRSVKSNDRPREEGQDPPDRQRAADLGVREAAKPPAGPGVRGAAKSPAGPGVRGAAKPPARKCTPTFS